MENWVLGLMVQIWWKYKDELVFILESDFFEFIERFVVEEGFVGDFVG